MTEGTTPSGSGTQPEVPAGDQQQIAEIQAEASQQQAHDAQYAYAFQQTTSGADPSALQAFTVQEMTQQAAGAGKGFEFSPQQIDDILKDAQGLLNDLRGDIRLAQQAHAAVKAPSPDPVSLKYEKAAKDMTQRNVAVIQSHFNAINDFYQKLLATKNNYIENEGLTAEQWNRLASGLDA